MKRTLTVTVLLLILCSQAWAANVFIDPTAGSGGDGTCGSPYDSWDDVIFSASDDYYQKVGTTWVGNNGSSAEIVIDVDGTSGDWIIFGAYTESAGPVCTCEAAGASITRPIIDNSDNANGRIFDIQASYIKIQNFDLRDGSGMVAFGGWDVEENFEYGILEYCDVVATGTNVIGGLAAVIIGNDDNHEYTHVTVRYCEIDLNEQVDDGSANDGIHVGRWQSSHPGSDYVHIHHNLIENYDHAAIQMEGDNGVIEYNKMTDSSGFANECLNNNTGDYNIWRGNYCYDAGVCQIVGGWHNVITHNIFDYNNQNIEAWSVPVITVMPSASFTVGDNTIANNTMVNLGNLMTGLQVNTNTGQSTTVETIYFYNNLCLGGGDPAKEAFSILDNANTMTESGCKFYNNLAYGNFLRYARVRTAPGSTYDYATAVAFNASSYILSDSNIESDPGLADVANGLYYPDAAGDNVVDAGYTVGGDCIYGFRVTGTDLTTTPMTAVTLSQNDYTPWEIGAFVYETGNPPATCGGISGTYAGAWNGEYSGDTDKLCVNSGASNKDGTATGATIDTWTNHGIAGPTDGGTYGLKLDADDERLTWVIASSDIFDEQEGTVWYDVYLAASTGDNTFFRVYYNANNWLYAKITATGEIGLAGQWSGGDNSMISTDQIPDTTWTTIGIAWSDTNNLLATKIGANSWETAAAANIAAFAGDGTTLEVGEASGSLVITDTFYVDNISLHTTYQQSRADFSVSGGSPTILDVVIINDIDGTPSVTINPTATWSDATPRFIGFKLSEQIINAGNPDFARAELDAGPITVDSTWIYYDRQLQIGADWYIVVKYIPQAGDRSTDLSFASTAAFVLNSATLEDGDGNALVMTLPRADIGGTGTITLAFPYTSTSPKEFTTSATWATAIAAGWHSVPDDNLDFNVTEDIDTDKPGTSGHEIVYTGTITGMVTIDENYIKLERMVIN